MNYDCELLPLINRPTRVTNSTATLIDNIFLSSKLVHEAESHVVIDNISDHFPCSVTLSGLKKSSCPVLRKKRKFTEKVVDSIKEDMMKIDWYEKLQPLTCNDGFNVFHQYLTDSLDKYAPEKEYASTNIRKHLPWFTSGLKKSSTKLKHLYKKFLKKNDETSRKNYKEFRRLYNKVKRVSMVMYYHTEITSHIDNSRRLWQIINKLSGKQIISPLSLIASL